MTIEPQENDLDSSAKTVDTLRENSKKGINRTIVLICLIFLIIVMIIVVLLKCVNKKKK